MIKNLTIAVALSLIMVFSAYLSAMDIEDYDVPMEMPHANE